MADMELFRQTVLQQSFSELLIFFAFSFIPSAHLLA